MAAFNGKALAGMLKRTTQKIVDGRWQSGRCHGILEGNWITVARPHQ